MRVNLFSYTVIVLSLVHILLGGVCGRVVNTSNSGSEGPGFKPRPLHWFLRQGTLLHYVSLHSGVMGTGNIHVLLGGWGNPAMDQHPIQG